jgi:hypothetical protein
VESIACFLQEWDWRSLVLLCLDIALVWSEDKNYQLLGIAYASDARKALLSPH